MRLTFVLTRSVGTPVGGYLVHYRMAEHLAASGHRVTVVHAREGGLKAGSLARWAAKAALVASGRRSTVPWHSFAEGVRVREVPWLHPALLPQADVTVLTAWQTSEELRAPTSRTGPLVQLVWDYEFWLNGSPDERARLSSSLSNARVTRVAGSSAVAGMLEEIGAPAVATVTPGLDGDFRPWVPPEQRPPMIGFNYRSEPHKATDMLLAALEEVHGRHPEAQVICFGWAGTGGTPSWVQHRGSLARQDLPGFYNDCSVFVLASQAEGWGLPAAEAMACGAALVTTANGGTADFTTDGVDALVVAPGKAEDLAEAISRLLSDDGLRRRLASAGSERASRLSWAGSARSLEAVLQAAAGTRSGRR